MRITKNKLASLLLRVGLASVLLYAAISSLVTPSDWVGYLPHMLTTHTSADKALKLISIYQIVLALWLLSGWYRLYAAGLATLTFLGIVLTNLGVFAITFRDLTMVFSSLALMFLDDSK